MNHSYIVSILHRVRRFLLTAVFRLFIGSAIWDEDTKDRYEAIFLSESTAQQKKNMLLSSSTSVFERTLLRIYLRYPFPDRHLGFHIDVCRYITMHLHSVTGLVDPSFETDIDDHIVTVYDPLRDCIAHKDVGEEDDGDVGKTIAIFRFTQHYIPLKSLTDSIFKGITRPVNVLCDRDMSMLYYDVLQAKPCSIADEETKHKIIDGRISTIALSYRHVKRDRRHLGMTKREFVAAVRALHAEALPANPPNEYCFWWDSCLKCSPKGKSTPGNWAAIGLASYAFCHVLSIRRASEKGEGRLWVDIECALARFSKGLTAVDVTDVERRRSSSPAEVMGLVPGFRTDPQWALFQGLVYAVAGDVYNSAVTFREDKTSLTRAGLLMLCRPLGIGVYRALFERAKTKVAWVASWSVLEERAFLTTTLLRLGRDQVVYGIGEAYLDICVHACGERVMFNDRRSWLPNSAIYQVESGDGELPYFVRDQVALLIKNSGGEHQDSMFGLLLYYQEETRFYAEAVHGCVVNLVVPTKSLLADSVSRLHVPSSSSLFPGFKQLYTIAKSASNTGQGSHPSDYEIVNCVVAWLWEENEMDGDTQNVYYEVWRTHLA